MNNSKKEFSDEGIVLRVSESKENDQIINIYTKTNGKKVFFVKSIKKPTSKLKSAGILGNILQVEGILLGDLYTLTGVEEKKTLLGHQEGSLDKLTAVNQITEITDKIATNNDETDVILYKYLKESLEWLSFANSWVVGKYFEWKVMNLLGYVGELEHCSNCDIAFSRGHWKSAASIYGGFFCRECTSAVDKKSLIYFSEEDNGFLRFLETADKDNISVYHPSNFLIKKMNLYFKKTWEFIFEEPLNSYMYLEEVSLDSK